jgi:DNA-binding transcriptional MerR regulator
VADVRELPAKLYFRIGEVAGIVGVEPHVLRYWETEFRSIKPKKSAKGQRVYSRRDVETLLQVRELLYAHRFTIAGARRKLRDGGVEPLAPEPAAAPAPAELHAASPPSEDAELLRETLVSLRGEIEAALLELDAL